MPAQRASTRPGVEVPRCAPAEADPSLEPGRYRGVLRDEHLGRIQTRELALQVVVGGQLHDGEVAACEVQPRETGSVAAAVDGRKIIGATLIQQCVIGQRAGRDDANDLPFDRPLARGRVTDLLTDGDRLAEPDEAGEIVVHGVIRHARHRNRLAGGSSAARQRDVDEFGHSAGIVIEQLVEVAHAVEQQHVRVLGLQAEVLLHHRGVGLSQRETLPIEGQHIVIAAGPTASIPWV